MIVIPWMILIYMLVIGLTVMQVASTLVKALGQTYQIGIALYP